MQNKRQERLRGKAEKQPGTEKREKAHTAEREEDSNLSRMEGRNAVREALRAGKTVERLYVQEGLKDAALGSLIVEAQKRNIQCRFVTKDRLDEMSETGAHQGVIAAVSAYEYAEVEDMLRAAEEKGEEPFLILLDGVEDPHNLGAILRTANLAGAHGVIIPKDRAVGLTAAAAKTSAGAVNYTPVARVTNLSRTIRELKEKGLWFVCADMDGEIMYRQNLKGPIGLVMGSEGSGVSRLVREQCDFVTAIPMQGDIDSLNVSVATGILAFEILRQRKNL
ncbi:MAG: 23S rRNA (guanosine(2251)-2'-O)-methyltransferase RlmB [Lachnospiraceae bacterium]|nr:23S rRNA (guanosine(2251)-2'-O)-methyltransferase RlmB [Lachnospiraceae bacterium]MBQ6196302.1 23S rRNA (guanosine(2251)-2'-O)-methyltransferase RlmB [Lachnospiraceae bacterium]